MNKNKIETLGYFTKRLRDNNYIIWKIFKGYNLRDTRKWTILVNPGQESVFITCHVNVHGEMDMPFFQFDDGGLNFKSTMLVKTKSMEVIIDKLIKNNVKSDSKKFKKKEEVKPS